MNNNVICIYLIEGNYLGRFSHVYKSIPYIAFVLPNNIRININQIIMSSETNQLVGMQKKKIFRIKKKKKLALKSIGK